MVYDIIIIGAGVSGAFVARELSKYELHICIVDKESDVSMSASKANSAIIHAGYDAVPGSLKARLNVRGNKMMEHVAKELDVPFKRTGSIMVAFNENDMPRLVELMERGVQNGVEDLSIISKEQLRSMEPNVSKEAYAALYAAAAGIICPYGLTAAAVENAVENGVELLLECEVTGIAYENSTFILNTGKGKLKSRYIVNAAGLQADTAAALAGDHSLSISPRKGEYILLDKANGKLVSSVIFQLPSEMGKGILVTPTVDGNLLIGPDAQDIDDKEDISTTADGLAKVIMGAGKAVPGLCIRDAITSFAGLRARPSTGDFIIGPSVVNNRFINVAGIESPGLTSAPATGEYVTEILSDLGLNLKEKKNFNPYRKRVIRISDMNEEELAGIIKMNPQFGRIVCRCEKVSEGEVVDCITRPAGARNLDAVKRRTRAGMGRCQGGFCSPRVMEILARELDLPLVDITKMGGSSKILFGRTK